MMKDEWSRTLNVWGVRLLGVFFLLWSLLDFVELITGTRSRKGFLGLHVDIGGLDIMTWIGVYVLSYTGYHLLKLNSQGRNWALIIFWPSMIVTGLYFLLAVISSISSSRFDTNLSTTLNLFKFQWAIEDTVTLLIVLGGMFLLNSIPLFFLMRKDVKNLFLKPDEIMEKIS